MGAFFHNLTPEIKVTVAENSRATFHDPNIYPQIELGVNLSYNMRHALNAMFCMLSVRFLVGELFCSHTHDHYANSMLYK